MVAALHTCVSGKTLVIASHNAGKVAEFRSLLAPFGVDVISAADAKIPEPEETGKTFVENAALKARHAIAACGLPALADDSGLSVPALGGAPGIYSARWAGPDKDFPMAFERIRRELEGKGVDARQAQAYFTCVLCLCLPGGQEHVFEGRIDGTLTFPPRGGHGFGYDPIFIPDGYDVTFGELSEEKKNRISHRAQAFAQLAGFLEGAS